MRQLPSCETFEPIVQKTLERGAPTGPSLRDMSEVQTNRPSRALVEYASESFGGKAGSRANRR